jgi:hypothetical protein
MLKTSEEVNMDRRARPPSLLVVVAVIVVLTSFAQPAQSESAPCNPNYVFHYLKTWLVVPTGTDDTANLQCAFDHAVKRSGSTVLLSAGTFHTGQVAVSGFVGNFRGVGSNDTIIKTLDRTLQVTPLNFFQNPPTPESGSNPWPSIFAFVGGDIVVSDLSFYTTPNSWTTGWTFTGLGVTVYELAHAFVFVGPIVPAGQNYTEANAALYRVRIEGLPHEGTLVGYNPINAIYYEGALGPAFPGPTPPIRGRFDVHDSEFRHIGGSTNLANLYDSHASITRNRFADSFEGMDIGGGVINTTYKYADNEVFNSSAWGLNLYGPFTSSTLLVKNNVVTGIGMGLYLDDTVTFAWDMKCRLLRNGVDEVTDVGIYLGTGVTDCLVVCKTPSDTVENLGTNNKLVGCQTVSSDVDASKMSSRPTKLLQPMLQGKPLDR